MTQEQANVYMVALIPLAEKYLSHCRNDYPEYRPLEFSRNQLKVNFSTEKGVLPNGIETPTKIECVVRLDGKVVFRMCLPGVSIICGLRYDTDVTCEYDRGDWWVKSACDELERIINSLR